MSKNREKDKGETVSCDVVDSCCEQIIAQINVMNGLIKVSSDLQTGMELLLKKFMEMQEKTFGEVFQHTSQAFQYQVDNKKPYLSL